MKKRLLICVTALTMIAVSGCCLSHDWQEATCTEPQTCAECGKAKGEALGHQWADATCTEPKTCTVCGATEGEALEHTWAEATCSAPKTCTVCGATEGKALEHDLTEANYQQAAICKTCGATVGEPLKAQFEEYGLKYENGLDVPYTYMASCNKDRSKRTAAEAIFSDFEVFESDKNHEAVDGYEWQAVTLTIRFSDDNAKKYGMSYNLHTDTYYGMDGLVNYNGEEWNDSTVKRVDIQEFEFTDDYEYCVCVKRYYFRVPVGYDGMLIALCDKEADERYQSGEEHWWNENTIFFRLNK